MGRGSGFSLYSIHSILMGEDLKMFSISPTVCGGVLNITSHTKRLLSSLMAFGCVCVHLTDVDSSAVALHQQQHKHMQRDQVDNKHISSPC